MKTFKDLKAFEKRLKKGICWGDWIKVNNREYKMIEYGDGQNDNYMLFQNKPTKKMIEVRYQVPTKSKGVITKNYQFYEVLEYDNEELYRY